MRALAVPCRVGSPACPSTFRSDMSRHAGESCVACVRACLSMVRTPHPEESPELYADVGTPDRARRCACEVRARVHAEQGRTNRRTPARRHRTIARHHLVPFTSMRCRPMLCGLPPPPRLRNPAQSRRPAQSRQHPGILSQLLRQQPSAASAARHLAGKQHWCRPREQADAHANEERKQAHAQDHRAPAQHLRRRSPEQGDAATRKDTNFFFWATLEGANKRRERGGGRS